MNLYLIRKMIGSNTSASNASSYEEGYKTGVDHVMSDLNDLMFNDNKLNDEERKAVKKIYLLLAEIYPN